MRHFRFALDPVLGHRERLETEQQVRMAGALALQRQAEAERDAFVARREAERTRLRTEHKLLGADDLRAAYAHLEFLDRRIVEAEGVIALRRVAADAERLKLVAAAKDVKVLETLKTRRRESFQFEMARLEQIDADDNNARAFERAHVAPEVSS